jgi:hypothetical protein
MFFFGGGVLERPERRSLLSGVGTCDCALLCECERVRKGVYRFPPMETSLHSIISEKKHTRYHSIHA